jgi:peptidoglycan glycosyltransferase
MRFMGAIGGGGVCAAPYIMDQVTSGSAVTYRADSDPMQRIMSKETAETLQEYMRNNVVSIYGSQNFPGLTVCAKSGTSQLGGEEVSNAMFSGFVADEEYPLAFVVVVENGGYGSGTCVPILREVLAVCKQVLDAQ